MRKIKQRIVSCFLAVCMIATLVPAFGITVGAALDENEAIYSVNPNEDGVTDNVIAAEYNGVSYVMGAISADGKAAAVPAVKRDSYGNNIVVDETTAELFKVNTELYTYSSGSYWLYRMKTASGYILDNYGNDYTEHKLAIEDKETVTNSDSYYNWRKTWEKGWFNYGSSVSIYLVVDGGDIYFKLGKDASESAEYITVDIFSRGCQHENMEYVPAVSPTCKKDGHGEYWYCPDCDDNGYATYFSDEDGLNGAFNPPVTLSYGAIDANHDGVCDDCGKNMPVFKKVTSESQIVAGGKYILVTKVGDKYYAAATGTDPYPSQLPAVEITPTAEGAFAFESAADAMMIELQFANGCTEWGNGIRYGFLTKFNGSLSLLSPMDSSFLFGEYDIRGAKYGAYVGLNSDGTAKIHSAYAESALIRSYTKNDSQMFSLVDYSGDTSYTESSVYLYRLTDTGTVGENTYDMTAVKSKTDYTVYNESGAEAEGGTNITGVTDALTQTAVNAIVRAFVEDNSIPGDTNIQINTSVNVTVKSYTADNSITLSLMPTAVVSGGGAEKTYDIPDSDFDGITPMTVILYTGGISPAQIIHEKQDGTNEYFYPEYSEKVMSDGEKPFYELYDNNGNMYVSFAVMEFSDIVLLSEPIAEVVTVTGVTIDETLSVNIGETKTPVWTVFPAGATNKNVTFTIDNPSVATVNEATGEVIGVKKGTATITVKTEDGNFTDTCTITVSCTHANKTYVPKKASTCNVPGWDAYKKCDDCGQFFNADGTAEISELPFRPLSTEHNGGTATCTEKAVCDVCGQPYGDYAAHTPADSWSHDDTRHWKVCTTVGCGAVIDGSQVAHSSTGTNVATCQHKAVCDVCNEEYGEFAPHSWTPATCTVPKTCSVCHATEGDALGHTEGTAWNSDKNNHWHICTVVGCGVVIDGSKAAHTASDWIIDTQATAATDGTKHKECTVCHYILETGTIPATGPDSSMPQIIEGDGTKVTSGGNVALSFRSDAAFSDFIRVEIDGKTLDAKHYTVKEGSTIVTLNGNYVSTLSVGEHTIGVVSVSGTATATFAVDARQQTTDPTNPNPGAQSPQTGDNSNFFLWMALLFVCGFGVVGTVLYGKKKI